MEIPRLVWDVIRLKSVTFGRRHFQKRVFERSCLEEYAACFRTVCVDATYYRFPKEGYIEGLMGQVPDDFKFSFKVPDEITIKNFPKVKTFGDRAGQANERLSECADFAVFIFTISRAFQG